MMSDLEKNLRVEEFYKTEEQIPIALLDALSLIDNIEEDIDIIEH